MPFGDGGYQIQVDADKLDEALTILEQMDENYKKEEDFREATQDDIEYEKIKHERKVKRFKTSKITNAIVIVAILALLIIYILRGKIL